MTHRHTAAAIRFGTRSEGALTIVEGRRCEMLDGDLVLTPPGCWHGHINAGTRRTTWFDAANMPLICGLDANFFEPGTRHDEKFWEVDEGDERCYAASGLVPAGDPPKALHSPKFRYPGNETRKLLAELPAADDGAKTLRYVNPLTGGPIMPTLDCYATRLELRPFGALCWCHWIARGVGLLIDVGEHQLAPRLAHCHST